MTAHLWAILSTFMNHREKPLHKDESFQSSNCKRALQAVSKLDAIVLQNTFF
jgi:hypothetical protein